MIYKNHQFQAEGLKGKDFESDEFVSCKFTGEINFVNFLNCKFKTSDLSQAICNIVSFTNCQFPESKLSNLDFGEINISNCDFSNSVMESCVLQKLISKNNRKKLDLKNMIFQNTSLKGSVFIFCDLKKADLAGSDLTQTNFENCNLKETNFIGCNINGANFENCIIDKTVLDMDGFIKYGNSKGFVLSD